MFSFIFCTCLCVNIRSWDFIHFGVSFPPFMSNLLSKYLIWDGNFIPLNVTLSTKCNIYKNNGNLELFLWEWLTKNLQSFHWFYKCEARVTFPFSSIIIFQGCSKGAFRMFSGIFYSHHPQLPQTLGQFIVRRITKQNPIHQPLPPPLIITL